MRIPAHSQLEAAYICEAGTADVPFGRLDAEVGEFWAAAVWAMMRALEEECWR